MEIKLAHRMHSIKPSATLAVADKATRMRASGLDIINLGVGEPDFDTPKHIKRAAIDAIEAGFTKYTAVDGIVELKQAISNKLQQQHQLTYALNQILVSAGGKHSIYNLCQALLEPGDEVLIPAPFWVSYPDMAALSGAIPVIIPTTAALQYKMTPAALQQAISAKTKLLFINSPSNPSGMAYTREELKALAVVLHDHPQVMIATDDMYEHVIWAKPFANILDADPTLLDRTIILSGVSKAYAMTGWRIGYAAGPVALIAAMKTIQSQSTSNPCSIAQKAALAALDGNQASVHEMVEVFQQRHDYVWERLRNMPGVDVLPADGTFYIFPSVQRLITNWQMANDLEFAEKLLQAVGIALVPGSAFGCEGCIRISFATSMPILQDAMDRLQRFIATNGAPPR